MADGVIDNTLNNVIDLVAKKLADKGTVINFNNSSMLQSIENIDDNAMVTNVAKLLSKQVINEVSLIKNKILPYMRDVEDAIKEKKSQFGNDSEISKYNIIPRDIPNILGLLKTRKVLKDIGKNVELGTITLSVPTPDTTTKDIEYFFTPQDGMDEELKAVVSELLVKYSKEDMHMLWDKYLSNISSTNTNIINIGANLLTTQSILPEVCLLWVLLVNLLEYQDELGLEDKQPFQVAISTLLDLVVNQLSNVANVVEANRNIGKLVLSIEDNGYTAVVDSKLYEEFIATYDPDVILGLLVSGIKTSTDTYKDSIIARADEYKTIWENKVKLDRFNAISRSTSRSKLVYSLIIGDVYDLIPQDEELQELRNKSIEDVRNNLERKMVDYTAVELEDEVFMARELVHLVLPNSLFYAFTGKMLEYEKYNADFTAADTASLATLDLILEYIFSQVTTSDMANISNVKEYNNGNIRFS